MPRKGHIPKEKYYRSIYNSPIVTKLINSIMLDGKGVAQEILYGAFERIEKQTEDLH